MRITERDADSPAALRPTSPVARQLIDATIEIIDAEGEVAVRVQDIVAAAGVPIPVLYRHFGNREGLVQAAQVARLVRDLDSELERFTGLVALVQTAEEFRALFDAILDRMWSDERRPWRFKRVSVLGSTYGRPALAAAVAQVQDSSINLLADAFRRPRDLGWIRSDLNLEAFAAWLGGQTLGRILIELGETSVDVDAYNAMSADAMRYVLFG